MEGIAYSFSRRTGETTGPVAAQYSPLEEGVLLRPAYTSFDEPPETAERQIAVFAFGVDVDRDELVGNGGAWSIHADWRGVTLYKTATAVPFQLGEDDIGVTPADVSATDAAPGSNDDVWSGTGWVVDAGKKSARLIAAATAERDLRLAVATAAIAPLQDAVDLDEATAAETAALTAWKKYRVALNRIQTQPGYPQNIDWPVAPQ